MGNRTSFKVALVRYIVHWSSSQQSSTTSTRIANRWCNHTRAQSPHSDHHIHISHTHTHIHSCPPHAYTLLQFTNTMCVYAPQPIWTEATIAREKTIAANHKRTTSTTISVCCDVNGDIVSISDLSAPFYHKL